MTTFWRAQAANLQGSAVCRDREIVSPVCSMSKNVAGRAAGNYRLEPVLSRYRATHALREILRCFNHVSDVYAALFHHFGTGRAQAELV